jgi:hypothetical protein
MIVTQLLAYPLSAVPGMPWTRQSVTAPLVVALNVVAGLHTNDTLDLGLSVCSMAWVGGVALLASVCLRFFYKERHVGATPVKVGRVAQTEREGRGRGV